MPSISFFHPFQGDYPLPSSIQRQFVQTPSGKLELLVAEPKITTSKRKDPIFFAHGGCGSAAVWLEWMEFFSQQHNIPCYAVSYRGHGSSWYPSYLRMYLTGKRTFGNDLTAAIKHVEQVESTRQEKDVKVVLVGHSSGGGLSQMILNTGEVQVSALALVGAIPIFGNYEVNKNWMSFDPWFVVRMMFKHFGHSMSALSSTKLVKQAFFCDSYPTERVVDFEKRMPRNESYFWPMSQMWRMATGSNVVRNIQGWGTSERIAFIIGGLDRLVTPNLNRRAAGEYRIAYEEAVVKGDISAKATEVIIEANGESVGLGVRYYVVEGAGHHLQNDLQKDEGAAKLLDFYEQL